MKKIILTLVLFGFNLYGFSQELTKKIGDNKNNIGTSSLLEIESPNKALVVTRISNTSDIAQPINGMIVYVLSENKFKIYQNNTWVNMFN
ncbi:hypothetical protein [Flavobacterium sp.]|jgi:hypothetical protein|uniref:hypothetical protein n=1 Tax=Flavobacterium sp. TaxID=239 RepID=UPI0037BF34CD